MLTVASRAPLPLSASSPYLTESLGRAVNMKEYNFEVSKALESIKNTGDMHALAQLEKLADQGNVRALYYVGKIYVDGCQGVTQNTDRARESFRRCFETAEKVFGNSSRNKYMFAAYNDLGCLLHKQYRSHQMPYCFEIAKLGCTLGASNSLIATVNRSIQPVPYQLDDDIESDGLSDGLSFVTCTHLAKLYRELATQLLDGGFRTQAIPAEFDQNKYDRVLQYYQCAKEWLQRADGMTTEESKRVAIAVECRDLEKSIQDAGHTKRVTKALLGYPKEMYQQGIECMIGSERSDDHALSFLQRAINYSLATQQSVNPGTTMRAPPAAEKLSKEEMADAHFRMAQIYLSGGVKLEAAKYHYEQAAHFGCEDLQAKILLIEADILIKSNALSTHEGKSKLEIINKLKQAHQLRHQTAGFEIAKSYEMASCNSVLDEFGVLVPNRADWEQACYWYEESAKMGNSDAYHKFAEIKNEKGKLSRLMLATKPLMSNNMLHKNDHQIIKNFEHAYRSGYKGVAYEFAHWYDTRHFISNAQDQRLAKSWYKLGAQEGDQRAQKKWDAILANGKKVALTQNNELGEGGVRGNRRTALFDQEDNL